MQAPITEQLERVFANKGDSQYGFEAVTQLEHALQAATLAEAEASTPELIAAALLHDIGHLLHDLPDDATVRGIDDRHEVLGQRFLESYFGSAVTEPVKLHVDAKRFLCATDSSYESQLSEPSRQSMKLQGGIMTPAEVEAFSAFTHHQEAVRLRRWDDLAKVVDLKTPPLTHFLEIIAAEVPISEVSE